MRQAKIVRTLEDGTEEVMYIDLPDKKSEKVVKKTSTKKKSNENNKKQEKEQATPTSRATIEIKRSES